MLAPFLIKVFTWHYRLSVCWASPVYWGAVLPPPDFLSVEKLAQCKMPLQLLTAVVTMAKFFAHHAYYSCSCHEAGSATARRHEPHIQGQLLYPGTLLIQQTPSSRLDYRNDNSNTVRPCRPQTDVFLWPSILLEATMSVAGVYCCHVMMEMLAVRENKTEKNLTVLTHAMCCLWGYLHLANSSRKRSSKTLVNTQKQTYLWRYDVKTVSESVYESDFYPFQRQIHVSSVNETVFSWSASYPISPRRIKGPSVSTLFERQE